MYVNMVLSVIDSSDTVNSAYLAGLVFGIVFAIIMLFFLMRAQKKDGKLKCKYDERQNITRGKGFKYSFFSMLIGNCILIVLKSGDFALPIEDSLLLLIVILISIGVYAAYCILNDGYFSLNEDIKKMKYSFAFLGVFNLLAGIMNVSMGRCIVEGRLTFMFSNVLVGIFMIYIYVVIMIKAAIDRKDEQM